jgi:hypothetical protein
MKNIVGRFNSTTGKWEYGYYYNSRFYIVTEVKN